jgi:hypothetical protein
MSQPPVPPAEPFVPPRKGHALELVLGAVIGGVDVVITGVLGLVMSANFANGAWGFAPLVVGLLIPSALLLNEATRWWGVGILIGYFLSLIVLGGACVAIIASFSG